jgi:hypothetical protein
VGVCTTICYYGPTMHLHFMSRGCQSSSYGIFEQIITSRPLKLRISILLITLGWQRPPTEQVVAIGLYFGL